MWPISYCLLVNTITCHPSEASANLTKDGVHERDLDAGCHEKGTCTDDLNEDDGCVIFDLFSGFGNRPGLTRTRVERSVRCRGPATRLRSQNTTAPQSSQTTVGTDSTVSPPSAVSDPS